MFAAYGIDILDPTVSLRRLRVLTHRLPAGAWPDNEHPLSWSPEAYLLAQLIDEIAALHWTITRAYGGKPSKPHRFPRPAPKRRVEPQARSSWLELGDELSSTPDMAVVVHDGS